MHRRSLWRRLKKTFMKKIFGLLARCEFWLKSIQISIFLRSKFKKIVLGYENPSSIWTFYKDSNGKFFCGGLNNQSKKNILKEIFWDFEWRKFLNFGQKIKILIPTVAKFWFWPKFEIFRHSKFKTIVIGSVTRRSEWYRSVLFPVTPVLPI